MKSLKKIIICFVLIAIMILLGSCGCEHNWQEANCKYPKVCTLCSKTEGNPSFIHDWETATCVSPQTCIICGETTGNISPNEHNYEGDSCTLCGTVQLNLNNYENYIECTASVKASDKIGSYYTNAECFFDAIGNSHYRYDNVYITISFSHYDKEGYNQHLMNMIYLLSGHPVEEVATPYDQEMLVVKLNLAGNASDSCKLSTPWSKEMSAYDDTRAIFDRTIYEVISVSGTVKEY